MYRIALLMLAAALSVGASRCDRDTPDDSGGVIEEGDGAAGAPAGGEGEACGPGRCAAGMTCCNASCGICAPSGGVCTQQTCEPAPGDGNPPPRDAGSSAGGGGRGPGDPGDPTEPGERCGKVTCAAGQECCNASCGTCAPPGGSCTEQFCGDPEPEPVSCGQNSCAGGEVCCNESCGICTQPGEGCTKQLCNDPGDPGDPEPIPGRPCDLDCEAGQHCEYVQVVCVRAPCPPLPQCVDTPRCGGFAGFTCPGAGMCEDDPSDDCDPENGGADCGGLCECQLEGLCRDGQVWNSAASACACEPASGGGDGGGKGEPCGSRTCDDGQVCCNASCGICTPPNGACIQIACL